MHKNILKKGKKKAIIISICFAAAVFILLILWVVCTVNTNQAKFVEKEEYYKMGESVALENNFFVSSNESVNGYFIKVNHVELANYKEVLEKNGGSIENGGFSKNYPAPKYVFLVNMTIKNEGNTDGSLFLLSYALYNKSLNIPIDFVLWDLMDENYDGWPNMSIVENSTVTLTIPFTPMPLDTGTNAREIEKRMENEPFYFCVSAFPTRKIIEVKADTNLN